MFYAYGEDTPGWKSRRKNTLFKRLTALIEKFAADEAEMSQPKRPYVELNPREDVVAIRRLTKLSSDLIDKLTSQADEVYREVMGLRQGKSGLPKQSSEKARRNRDSLVTSEQTRKLPRVPSR